MLTPLVPIDQPLQYTLRNVEVNETPGDVAITVTEAPVDGRGANGLITTLDKLEAPLVSRFSATPAQFDAVDEAVELSWSAAPAALGYLFQVRSDADWTSPQLQVDAGGNGAISSPQLIRTTKFWLDVIDSSSGADETIATFDLTVPLVGPPTIEGAQPVVQGLVATLRWATIGATSCSVYFDGHEKVTGAPPDTWENGFPVFIGLGAAGTDVSVVAIGPTGEQSPPLVVGTLTPDDPVRLAGAPGSGSVAISADGAHAYVGTNEGFGVVDLHGKALLPALVPTGDGAPPPPACQGVAYVPGDAGFDLLNWVVTISANAVFFLCPDDTSKWAAGTPQIVDYTGSTVDAAMTGPVAGPTSSPAGNPTAPSWNSYGDEDPTEGAGYAWSCQAWNGTVSPGKGQFLSTTYQDGDGGGDGRVFDSALASCAGGSVGNVVLPFVAGTYDGAVLMPGPTSGGWFFAVGTGRVVVGANARFAIAGAQDGTVATFDLLNGPRRAGSPTAVGGDVAAVGITPDGVHGFVATTDGTIHSIDVAAGTVDEATTYAGFQPAGLAVSPTWPNGAVVVTGSDGEVILL